MTGVTDRCADFLKQNGPVVRIVLTRVRGSSPRDEGAEMFVAKNALLDTIGGGQLEYLAIKEARDMLRGGALNKNLDIPLGPEIGQCCGGRVELALSRLRSSDKKAAIARVQSSDAALQHVYVMGAGHVGRALANQFQHLPVHCVLIDTRADEIGLCDADVETRVSVLPEIDISNAPSGSAFIVLTHDHGMDFLLTQCALERGDAAYVGMIGSETKRAKFSNWMRKQYDTQTIGHLNCPIGASGSRDKRPSIIASFVVAEVMAELTSETVAIAPLGDAKTLLRGSQNNRKGKSA